MKRFIVASIAAASVAAIDSVTCTANAHSVGQLPYYNPNDTQPCQYAGTLPSNAEETHHMFYWMYPAADSTAPVTLWLNGGPGASSTFANFLMNGPQRITRTGTGVDDFLVTTTDQTWTSLAHMIFIDQPVGTGFSWGEPLLTNMTESSEEFVYFLQQLFTMYPEFVGKDLYFTGESYGGKYLPAYSYAMLMHNTTVGSTYFNLKATLCGDPYTAPVTQRTHMHIVPEALNIIDESNMPQIAALEQRCLQNLTNKNWTDEEKGDTCSSIMGYIEGVSGDAYPYDSRIFGYDWDPIEQPTIDYFTISGQLENIFELIHVADSTKRPVFEMGSAAVAIAFAGDQLLDYQWYIQQLIQMESPFLIYAGEFDSQDGPKTQEFWLRGMEFEGSIEFWNQSRQVYWNDYPTTAVGGYYRESAFFSYLTVPKAGHFVPNNNYWASWNFFNDYIQHQSLQCHAADGDCEVTVARCNYMNNCSGNGTCQDNGQCQCNFGWKGADCAMTAIQLVDGDDYKMYNYGPKYYSFTKQGGNLSELTLDSSTPMDIFISAGNSTDPTQFSHDVAILQTQHVTLISNQTHFLQSEDGYSVTAYLQSMDEAENHYYTKHLNVEYKEASKVSSVQNTVRSIMDASYKLIKSDDEQKRSVFQKFFDLMD